MWRLCMQLKKFLIYDVKYFSRLFHLSLSHSRNPINLFSSKQIFTFFSFQGRRRVNSKSSGSKNKVQCSNEICVPCSSSQCMITMTHTACFYFHHLKTRSTRTFVINSKYWMELWHIRTEFGGYLRIISWKIYHCVSCSVRTYTRLSCSFKKIHP